MAVPPTSDDSGNTAEYVAYRLYRDIAHCEGQHVIGTAQPKPDRKWILDTYAECLTAVKGRRAMRQSPA